MPDYTDLELAKMEKQLNKIYKQAQSEIQEKWDKYMTKIEPKIDKAHETYKNELFNGNIEKAKKAKAKYEELTLSKTLHSTHYQAMVNQVTDKLADTNQIALTYLNDQMPGVYCHSFNEFAGQKIKGYTFELVNEETIKNLIKDGNKSLLPQKTLNIVKDKLWNTKNINSQVLQGILQGESIDKISKRLQNVTDMNHNSAVRNARTMTTGAENKGRQDSFVKAKNDGIIMKRRWVVAHDDRLRDWHAELDGVEVDVDEPFTNDYGQIMYPGDPDAHPANVYNCRCALRAVVKGFKPFEKPVGIYAKQYQDVSMSKQYNNMFEQDKSLGNEFYKTLKAAGKPSEIWSQYILGTGNKTVAKQIDDVLAKYKGTPKTVLKPDLSVYQGKSMTKTFYAIKDDDKVLSKQFWGVLQAEDNASAAWSQYLNGTASKELTDKLDDILLKYKGTKPVETVITEESKNLIKAKEKLAVAKGNLDSLGTKTYSGIWKEDVTLADYEAKKGSIQAKKEWYQDQIEKYKLMDPDSDLYKKIPQFEQYLKDLDEFETKGKLYVDYEKQYKAAVKKVKALTPVGEQFGPEAYTQMRKDNAIWAKNGKEADDVLRSTTGEIWRNATKAEKDAIYDYTVSYHKFNEPLRGIEYGSNAYKGVGKVDLGAGHHQNGKALNAMTDLLEKSELPEDQWFQRGCGYSNMDKFFNCKMDLLRYGTQEELEEKLLGKTVTEYGFMSMGSAKGKGFTDDIIMNIYAPQGTKALYVEPFSGFGGGEGKSWDGIKKQTGFGSELETIMQQNTEFRIVKIERKSGTLYIDLDVIGQNTPQRWKP